jgi:D-serine deaminase-like pyridoxal phosphate-dependent protein
VGEGYLEICLESKRAIEESGIDVEIVSTGETFTFDIALKYPEITEIQGGTYALMDLNYPYMPFDIAVKVFSTIIDIEDDKITIDAGNKCIAAPNNATPLIEGVKSELVEMGLDYSIHKISDNKKYNIGDKVYLLTTHEDGLINRWDKFVGIRKEIVEGSWDILGRGCHH